jgi:sugar/nucleoside kinase (ribokinase family)
MRIVVVGTIVADTIEHENGSVTESLGGIAHTVSALAALAGGRHTIVPICRVGEDGRARVEAWAAGLDGVSLEGVKAAAGPQPTVRLSYGESSRRGERVERLQDAPEPLDADDTKAATGADVVIVNCITGSDLTPVALRHLRASAERTYLDVHSLVLGTDAHGTRFYRGRDDWPLWLTFADVVQCNLAEAATLCGIAGEQASDEAVAAAIERLLAAGFPIEAGPGDDRRREHGGVGEDGRGPEVADACMPRVWLLTLGAAGALLLSRQNGVVTRRRFSAPDVRAADPTGAGDAFGAGYVCAWLEGCGPAEAAARAVVAGAAACTRGGVPEPVAFRRAIEELSEKLGPS